MTLESGFDWTPTILGTLVAVIAAGIGAVLGALRDGTRPPLAR
jgi:hypothetical protein